MYFNYCTIYKCKCGTAIENQARKQQINGASDIRLSLCAFSLGFTSYLRNGRSVNFRAIENCICGLCCMERKMRTTLQTVEKITVHFLSCTTKCTSTSMLNLLLLKLLIFFLSLPFSRVFLPSYPPPPPHHLPYTWLLYLCTNIKMQRNDEQETCFKDYPRYVLRSTLLRK